MKKKLFYSIILIFISGHLFSQEKNFSAHNSQIQMDVLGPGGMLSFHFESRFSKSNTGLGFKAGLGIAPYGLLEQSCNTGAVITFPMGLSYLVGKKDHLLEIGAGSVFKFGGGTKRGCLYIEDSFFENGETVYWYGLLGYRYQPSVKKLSWRIFLSPLFQKDNPVKFWGGAGVGLKLRSSK